MADSTKKKPTSFSHVTEPKTEKPLATKKTPSKRKDGEYRRAPTTIFGRNAVTRYLRIPQTGSITAVELTVFLPELLRTPGILRRFFQNGADAHTLAKISSRFRATVKDHHTPATAANAMRHITQSAMRHLEDEEWTERRHKAGHYDKPDQVWDQDNLTFAGVKNYCEERSTEGRHKQPATANVYFASLAADVVVFPSGDDELDLTRCVKAAVANTDLSLMFPRDYSYLTRLLGGPQSVRPAHRDSELFGRWKRKTWFETPSGGQVDAASDPAQYKFTREQRKITEEYLEQPDTTEELDLCETGGPGDPPINNPHDSYTPSANESPLPLNSPLVGSAMDHSSIRLATALDSLNEDDMSVLYRSHGTPEFIPNLLHVYLQHDRTLPGPNTQTDKEAITVPPSSHALNSNTVADDDGSRFSPGMNWHLGYHDG
jgi:hypothetical protein